jgi:hypothetical protein
VPLDAHEEDQFRRITAQLRDEDPSFGRRRWRPPSWSPTWGASGRTVVAVVGLVVGLALLPTALAIGVLPLGAVGYLVAALAATRPAEAHPWPARRRARATDDAADGETDGAPDTPSLPAWRSSALARGVLAATGVAVVALAIVSAGPTSAPEPDGAAPTDLTSPAAELSPAEASAAEQAPPAGRRGFQRVATTTATP